MHSNNDRKRGMHFSWRLALWTLWSCAIGLPSRIWAAPPLEHKPHWLKQLCLARLDLRDAAVVTGGGPQGERVLKLLFAQERPYYAGFGELFVVPAPAAEAGMDAARWAAQLERESVGHYECSAHGFVPWTDLRQFVGDELRLGASRRP